MGPHRLLTGLVTVTATVAVLMTAMVANVDAANVFNNTTDSPVGHGLASGLRLPDGRVAIVGGVETVSPGLSPRLELFDPIDESWTAGAPMTVGRTFHSAVILADGRMLIAGGVEGSYSSPAVSSATVYDSIYDSWSDVASMTTARAHHSVTLLRDDRVLVVGGNAGPTSAEIYDVAANHWTLTAAPNFNATVTSATSLQDGRVLVTYQGSGGPNASLYTPLTDTWAPAGSPVVYPARAAPLSDGRVLVVGANSAAVFDPQSDSWRMTQAMVPAVTPATLTYYGHGYALAISAGVHTTTAVTQVYDEATNAWTRLSVPDTSRTSPRQVWRTTRRWWRAEVTATGEATTTGGSGPSACQDRRRCRWPPRTHPSLCNGFPDRHGAGTDHGLRGLLQAVLRPDAAGLGEIAL